MSTPYETDVIAWAEEQARLLRTGNLSALDIEHVAEEIEDVGKSERRELANRIEETGLDVFPEDCFWSVEKILSPTFYPD